MTNFDTSDPVGAVRKFYVPLLFYFNRSPGMALPIIALSFHEVKIHIELAAAAALAGIDPSLINVRMWVDYFYLGESERKTFARAPTEYLIETLQYTGAESSLIDGSVNRSQNVRLSFNHPCKALFFCCQGTTHGKFSADGTDEESSAPIWNAKIQLNGHDRFYQRDGSYFNKIQPFQSGLTRPRAGIYMYSFALRPAESAPSGSLNLSRIDNTTLQLQYKKAAGTTQAPVTDESSCMADAANLKLLQIF